MLKSCATFYHLKKGSTFPLYSSCRHLVCTIRETPHFALATIAYTIPQANDLFTCYSYIYPYTSMEMIQKATATLML